MYGPQSIILFGDTRVSLVDTAVSILGRATSLASFRLTEWFQNEEEQDTE